MASWHSDFLVNDWHVSPKLNRVSHNGESVTIKHKSMAVFVFLADANGELVTRDEIMDAVWPGMEVTDDVLTQSIVELRKVFDDDAKHPKFIETIPRVGFRLVGNLAAIESPVAASIEGPPPVGISRWYLFATFAVLIAGAITWTLIDMRDGGPGPVIVLPVPPIIAVLPFVNMTGNPDNDYFSDGLTEEIIFLVGRVPRMDVIGRTSSFAFKTKDEDLRVIGQTLGASHIVEGTVRMSGDQLRISAQLIDVVNGQKIWGDIYSRTMTEVFAVQNDVAVAVVNDLLRGAGWNPIRGSLTENSEAYALYLRARILLDAQQGYEAIPLLIQATEMDSKFAEGFELLAYSYWQQAGTSIPNAQAQRLCNDTAARALALEADLTFARALYELTNSERDSDAKAIELLGQARREQPSNSAPLRLLIYELTLKGYLGEAHQLAVEFVAHDPLSPIAHFSLGESFVALGQYSDAYPSLQLSLKMDNEFAKWFVAAFDLFEGRDGKAIARYEADLEIAGLSDTGWVRELITRGRDPVSGQAYLDRRIPEVIASLPEEYRYYWQFILVEWSLYFGFLDHYYETIFADGPNDKIWSRANILIWEGTVFRQAGFTAHPKYLEAAEKIGLIDVWEQRGPPDFCSKETGNWVCT
ncbi:MAG: winged helix-turn-helix domain-containing protein [Proteobacteria bacterium]|nr:winged helix-turn-helix domain-containing protein [Pseudomonadota bacterium]